MSVAALIPAAAPKLTFQTASQFTWLFRVVAIRLEPMARMVRSDGYWGEKATAVISRFRPSAVQPKVSGRFSE